jgi:membrane-bound serine protease (ClpP class)
MTSRLRHFPRLVVIFTVLSCLSLGYGQDAKESPTPGRDAAKQTTIDQIRIEKAITPPVASFIGDSIRRSSDGKAEALLILLDTPGGLDTAMRQIVKDIMDAPIPVIVYVYPSGARAASAGTIILLSAHIAAMAPGTNVGAATPVSIGKDIDKEMNAKVVQDAQAYARSIAKLRGRNAE